MGYSPSATMAAVNLSVVIPTYNRRARLALVLDALDNWNRRHATTRALVSFCLGRARVTAAAAQLLSAGIILAAPLPLGRLARGGCSLLANLLYWDGVAEAVGVDRLRAIFVRPLQPDYGT